MKKKVNYKLNNSENGSVVLILLDGWGIAKPGLSNIFAQSVWPNLFDYLQQYPLAALAGLNSDFLKPSEAYWQIGNGQKDHTIPGLGEVINQPGLTNLLDQAGLHQAYLAETENFPLLINYLADNQQSSRIDYQLFSSPLNNNYSENVLSASRLVIEQSIKYWRSKQPDFMTISLASWNLISRYGDVTGAIRAVAEIDKLLPKLIASIQQVGATIILTSAYGRLEEMIDPLTDKINMGPSANPVPMLIIGQQWQGQSLGEGEMATNDLNALPLSGSLRSIAPTALALLGIERPSYLVNPLLPTSFNQ